MQSRNVSEVYISLLLLDEIRKKGLRYLLVANLESRESFVFINYFSLAILGVGPELEIMWAVNEGREHC